MGKDIGEPVPNAVEQVVGTVLRHPSSGDVALCVRQYGKTYWRICATDDRTWIETDRTWAETEIAGWDVLFDPQTAEESVDD
jgi:hypothetical protein